MCFSVCPADRHDQEQLAIGRLSQPLHSVPEVTNEQVLEMHRSPVRPAHRDRGVRARGGPELHEFARLSAAPAGIPGLRSESVGVGSLDTAIAR